MIRIYKILLFAFVFIANSCYKDEIIKDNTDIISKTYPPIDVSARIVGEVHDEFGKKIKGYTCSLMNNYYSAANSPYYSFNVSNANKNGTLLTVDYDECKYEFLLKPIENDINYFSHSIVTKPKIIQKSSDEEIYEVFYEKLELKVIGNSYIDNNNHYSGNVIVKAFIPDLKNPNHLEAIPGGHLAKDINNNMVWLNYFNVIDLKITSDMQSPLEIEDKKAKISLLNSTCDDCSIWRYDEELHYWKYFSDINNIGKTEFYISKPGFFSIAKSYVFNLVEGSVFIEKEPWINQPVDIFFEDRLVDRVYTTNKGKWFTHLPLNQPFSYKVDVECNKEYGESFETGEEDSEINAMVMNKNSISSVNINGVVRNCNNKKIGNNFFQIEQGENSKFYFFDNPEVNFELPYCNNKDIGIISADKNWDNIGPKIFFFASEGDVSFRNIYTCNQIEMDGYFNLNIDNNEKLFRITESKYNDGRTELKLYDEENINTEFSLWFSGKESRQYTDNELNIFFKNLNISDSVYETNCSNSTEGCGFEKFYIYNYGNKKGDWIKGTFEGRFWIKSYNPLNAAYKKVKGDFLVKRYFN